MISRLIERAFRKCELVSSNFQNGGEFNFDGCDKAKWTAMAQYKSVVCIVLH